MLLSHCRQRGSGARTMRILDGGNALLAAHVGAKLQGVDREITYREMRCKLYAPTWQIAISMTKRVAPLESSTWNTMSEHAVRAGVVRGR